MGKLINANESDFNQILESEKNVILVDFWAEWCGPCRMLGPILEGISNEKEDVNIVKINVDDNPGLAAEYSVRNIPVVFFIKNGVVLEKLVGVQSKDKYVDLINKYSEEVKEDESED